MASFSFFDADNEHREKIIKRVNGAEYEGNRIKIEVTESKQSNGNKRHDRNMTKRKDKKNWKKNKA